MNSSVLSFCLGHCFISVIVRKACYIPAPKSNVYIKKSLYTVMCLVFQEVFQKVYSAVVFGLLLPLGQSSVEFLLACSGGMLGSCPLCGRF